MCCCRVTVVKKLWENWRKQRSERRSEYELLSQRRHRRRAFVASEWHSSKSLTERCEAVEFAAPRIYTRKLWSRENNLNTRLKFLAPTPTHVIATLRRAFVLSQIRRPTLYLRHLHAIRFIRRSSKCLISSAVQLSAILFQACKLLLHMRTLLQEVYHVSEMLAWVCLAPLVLLYSSTHHYYCYIPI